MRPPRGDSLSPAHGRPEHSCLRRRSHQRSRCWRQNAGPRSGGLRKPSMTQLHSDPLNDPVTQAKTEKLAQKDAVLRAALPNIPFDGWTMATLEAAAEKEGLGRPAAHRLFPGGAKDAIAHFRNLADRLMLEDLGRLDLAGM